MQSKKTTTLRTSILDSFSSSNNNTNTYEISPTNLRFKNSGVNIDNLTEYQIAELRKAFNVMDSDGNGEISNQELKNLMKYLGS